MENDQKKLQEKHRSLIAQRKRQEKIAAQTRQKLNRRKVEFEQAQNHPVLQRINPSTIKKTIRTTAAYLLGRRNRKNLYSKTYKRKQAANDLKKYTQALYEKGFTEKALIDLKALYAETNHRYLKRAIAWELTLFYANEQTKTGARLAQTYLAIAKHGETDQDLLRSMSIIQAECHMKLNEVTEAKKVLMHAVQIGVHPDLYLALANTEESIEQKLTWINKVYESYHVVPITMTSVSETTPYDQLQTAGTLKTMPGPKVSVILPAYNSETGIQTAIDSILHQTWENIELIIVDDCSTDATFEVIQAYAKKDERIKVLKTETNSGPYVARNLALAQATGEFVTINDADDWSHAQKIAIQATHLINNASIIANTSEQARLTEDLEFYRRGTRGKYIFSNMSSLMFRREPVTLKLGFWDSVRFAADGEFKRRLITCFGEAAVVDLTTGPLSLPRQTANSLTGASAFGYHGFFMGARKEYVESFTTYYESGSSLYYPQNQQKRLFPVPEPMLPNGNRGVRHFDVVMIADYEAMDEHAASLLTVELEKNKQLGLTTALVQMYRYELKRKDSFNEQIREHIDGVSIQVVVYGEKVLTDVLIIRTPSVLAERQRYIPTINTTVALIIIEELPKIAYNRKKDLQSYQFRQCLHQLMAYFDKKGRWYPLNTRVRTGLNQWKENELKGIPITEEDWTNQHELHEEKYAIRLKDWLIK
jgi:glycosyltransferase involved in cell wall biosynthesis